MSQRVARRVSRPKSTDAVGNYLDEVSAHALLTAEDEVRLARAIEAGDAAGDKLVAGGRITATQRRELQALVDAGTEAKAAFIRSNLRLVISIAKRLEELYYPNDELPYSINKRSPTLRVLQQLRNEAHRFAIGFHRDQRSRAAFKSSLTEIKGIGDKTTKELIAHFKSVKRIMEAGEEELAEVVGRSKAKIVYDHFH